MVHAADEEVEFVQLLQLSHHADAGWSDVFGLETDKDMDLMPVLPAQ